jgi:hypothetical protein
VTGTTVSVDAALAAVFREEAGRLTGALTRALGNFNWLRSRSRMPC